MSSKSETVLGITLTCECEVKHTYDVSKRWHYLVTFQITTEIICNFHNKIHCIVSGQMANRLRYPFVACFMHKTYLS